MKYILFIFFLTLTVQAQNVWYVDMNNTSGNYDGRSWETAWRQLDSSDWAGYVGINWSIIGDGDTIYVSGGTDSTAYYPLSGDTRMFIRPATEVEFNEQVVIARAWQEGHNGEVYFTTHSDSQQGILNMSGVHNVKFYGLNFVDRREDPATVVALIDIFGKSVVMDSCYVYSKNHSAIIGFSSSPPGFIPRDNKIINCFIDTEENDLSGDTDPIGFNWGVGHYVFDNNVIILRNGNETTGSHKDVIQMGAHGDSTDAVASSVRISNNLIIDTRPEGTSWNAVIYMVAQMSSPVYCFNNIIVFQKRNTSITSYWFDGLDEDPFYLKKFSQQSFLFNNTTILKGLPSDVNALTSNADTTIAKNNIFVIDTSKGGNEEGYVVGFDGPEATYAVLDYNYYGIDDDSLLNSTKDNFSVYGPFMSWEEWQASGQDTNSFFTRADAITFANKYGLSKEDYYTETGRGLGVNLAEEHPEIVALFPDIMFDALGNPRPDSGAGAWDMGALQFQEDGIDTIPNTFSFTPVTDAERNTVYNSNTNTLAGIDEGEFSTIWIVDGEYQINSGSWTSSPGTISLGDDFRVRRTSHATLYEEPVSCTLYISTRSAVFTITTEAEPPPPTEQIRWFSTDGKKLTSQGKRLVFITNEE